MENLAQFFNSPFIPHGHCYLWKPSLVWLHVGSDALIAITYYSIPLLLIYLMLKREDLPFNWIFFLFGSFILFCGTGHLLEIWTLWHPDYWLSGFVKALTAAVSVLTAIELSILIPKILAIPSSAQLETANNSLTAEIKERKETEQSLERSQSQLIAKNQELKKILHELQCAKSHLLQSEKMSSLGQMVAGIAHEINNPVNFIFGNLIHAKIYTQDTLELIGLYQEHYSSPPPEISERTEDIELNFLQTDLPKLLGSMTVGAERIRNIVLALRNFSRVDKAQMEVCDIHRGLDDTLVILGNRLKAKPDRPEIKTIKEYSQIPPIECYPGQLNQVFTNLLSNAIDAIEGNFTPKNSYTLRICSKVVDKDWVEIQITDSGSGIPKQTQSRLFEAFFTTKPIGKGTGLGLSISYQIIAEQHNGIIWCQDAEDGGTQFTIKIPQKQPQEKLKKILAKSAIALELAESAV
ncbi:sensor histidine kinase [Lusitaniella coriacea]|uniref:sensor histidine kinase n=1 Tax=Lusitaniella coriacea TaxID=1983105 RepID=UPI003CF72E9E